MRNNLSRSSIVITGASGQLGTYLLREVAVARPRRIHAWSGSSAPQRFGVAATPVQLTDHRQVRSAFHACQPDTVIHAAAVSGVAGCFQDPDRAQRVNVHATQQLVELVAEVKARMVYVSTDLVFDGMRGNYAEQDPASPLSVYGRTKVQAEQAVLDYDRGVVARVSLLFGPSLNGRRAFFDQQIAALKQGTACRLFTDEWRTPLSLQTAAQALLELAYWDFSGLIHIGGPERMSRWEMGRRLAESLGADSAPLVATRQDEIETPEPRPSDVSLDSSRWRAVCPHVGWPAWEQAIQQLGL